MKSAVNCLLVWGLGFAGFSVAAFAAIIGPKDNRMTYQEYANANYGGNASQFEATYSGSGILDCEDNAESASVVRRNDIIVFSAHSAFALNRTGKCAPIPNLNKCYFRPVSFNGVIGRRIPIIARTLVTSGGMDCDFSKFSTDWAIVRLAEPANEVVPYEPLNAASIADQNDGYRSLVGGTVTALAGRGRNFQGHSESPSICEAKIGYVWPLPGTSGVQAYALGIGCSAGLGNSGGAILINDGMKRKFLGVMSATSPDERNFLPFSNHNYTGGPLLEGEFYARLMSM